MAITTTINRQTVQGDNKVVFGKSVLSGASNAETVVTGLSRLDFFQFITNGATQKGQAVNADFPLASGSVPIITESNDATVYWKAEGK